MTSTSPRRSASEACLLPLVGEAVDLGQLRCVGASVDEEREGPAGVDGLELVRVADEQHLGARGLRRSR